MWLCFFLYTGSMRSNLLRLRSRSERTSLATTTACRLQQPHLTDRDSGDEDRHQHTGGKDAERRLAAARATQARGRRRRDRAIRTGLVPSTIHGDAVEANIGDRRFGQPVAGHVGRLAALCRDGEALYTDIGD